MENQLIECVPNFSEGRDMNIIKQITDEIEGVSVHPEVIGIAFDESEIKRLDPDQNTILPGQVKDIFYQGDFRELTVTLKDVQQDLSIHLARVISHGKELCAGLDIIVYWDRLHNNTLIS